MADVASEKVVNDIVHGIIKLPEYIRVIIDTEQFQRLRYISQLGLKLFVYPSSNYCRFEHSIGTFHLASELIKQIQKQLEQEKNEISQKIFLNVTDEEVKCVEIAALCHDLGHGPYSHFWETALKGVKIGDKKIETKKHEKLSAEIFEKYICTNKSVLKKNKLEVEHVELIKYLITGDRAPGRSRLIDDIENKKKYFLYEIVANKKSGLDVDKFDYLCRDSIYLGWSNKNKIHDIKRIMHFLRVAKDDQGEWHLAMRDREIFHIHDVFYYRHLLHRYGYQHKTVKALECMFKQAIKEIVGNETLRNEFIRNVMGDDFEIEIRRNEINAAGEAIAIEEVFFSHQFISRVCDHHVWEIMKKLPSGVVNDLKTNAVRQIQERKLIKLHCQIQVARKENMEGIVRSMKSLRGKVEQINYLEPENQVNALFERLRENRDGNVLENLNKLHEITQNISQDVSRVKEALQGNVLNYDIPAIAKIFSEINKAGGFNNLPDEGMQSLFANLKDFLVGNKDIQRDVDTLAARLKQSYPIIRDVATSKFSLQSEDKGNPLLAVWFYEKTDNLRCFKMKEEDLPDLVKLKTDEFIMMIFINHGENDENLRSLNAIIRVLCTEPLNANQLGIDNILKRYKFRKNVY